ncbi:MAG: bacillithiol system redox-active protein YtxJ [Chryseolinea sp.]
MNKTIMKWNELKSTDQLDQIREESRIKPVLIFKYSNRCSVSQLALDRFERKWSDEKAADIKPYFLDLISFREVSNRIAQQFKVHHESPQVLLIKNGEAIYDGSHFDIDFEEIVAASKA